MKRINLELAPKYAIASRDYLQNRAVLSATPIPNIHNWALGVLAADEGLRDNSKLAQ